MKWKKEIVKERLIKSQRKRRESEKKENKKTMKITTNNLHVDTKPSKSW